MMMDCDELVESLKEETTLERLSVSWRRASNPL